jgi:hypothetical protein
MNANHAEYYQKELNKKNIKTLLHSSKSDDELKIKLENVDNLWIDYQVVIITPCIEAGVSFNKSHFDRIFIILSDKSTSQRGLLQMCNRIRNLKNNRICVFMNSMKYRNNTNFYAFNEVKFMHDTYLSSNNLYDEIDNDGNITIKKQDPLYIIKIYNYLEQLNKQKIYFIPYLIKLLKDKKYTWEFKHYKIKLDNNDDNDFLIQEIFDAEDIDKKYYNKLLTKQKNNEATRYEKILIERYNYKDAWKVENITMDFLTKNYKKLHILNNYKLIGGKINDAIFKSNKLIGDIDIIKGNLINEMLKKLGFIDVNDKNKICEDIFIKNKDNFIFDKNIFDNKFNMLFMLSKKKINSMKSFLGAINSVFFQYGFKIKTYKSSHGKYKKKYFLLI